VYVIELGDAEGAPTNPPTIYVGQSTLSPQARFRNHRAGIRAARRVRRHGLWRRWRLFDP
jgi:hypothetical protein